MSQISDVDMESLERQLGIPRPKPKLPVEKAEAEAPVATPGLHQLISDLESTLDLAIAQLINLKARVTEFDRLQTKFYNGHPTT